MKTQWIPTNDYYHEIIAAADDAQRTALYRERFIAPWKPMMDMIGPMFQADPADDVAVARSWAWVMPEQLHSAPPVLEALELADAWCVGAEALAEGAARLEFQAELPFDVVEGWLVIADPERADPTGRGYTGAIDFTQPRLVAQYDTVTPQNLRALPGAVVHEFNHLVRLRVFPWDMAKTSVADYIIHEGVAESFAGALFGEQALGFYVTDFDDSSLETARALIRDGLGKTGFDVIRAYIFGEGMVEKFNLPSIGMPTYGGYAIGYRVVQAYLERTGKSIEAATFTPALEIIAESGYFD